MVFTYILTDTHVYNLFIYRKIVFYSRLKLVLICLTGRRLVLISNKWYRLERPVGRVGSDSDYAIDEARV